MVFSLLKVNTEIYRSQDSIKGEGFEAAAGSFIVAGYDPRVDTMPSFILEDAAAKTCTGEDEIYSALTDFYKLVDVV